MILFFGPAGAGKSVQGQRLAASHNWPWISTGQLFRETKDEEILKTIAAGSLISDEQTNSVLEAALSQNADASQLILDGYPRRIEQAQWLIDNLPRYQRKVDAAIVIDVPKEEVLGRLASRGRHDDTPESIEKRHATYHAQIEPILDFFQRHNIPVLHIDGVGTMDEVQERIDAAVQGQSGTSS